MSKKEEEYLTELDVKKALIAQLERSNEKRLEAYAKQHGVAIDDIDPVEAGIKLNKIPDVSEIDLMQLGSARNVGKLNLRINPLLLTKAQAKANRETSLRKEKYGENSSGVKVTVASVIKRALEAYVAVPHEKGFTVPPEAPPADS